MHPIFADIQQDLDDSAHEAEMLESARLRAAAVITDSNDPVDRWIHVNAVASGVEKVYSGIERVLVRIARSIDRYVPDGPDWHVTLLRRMAHPLPERRPTVISAATMGQLDVLRAFRHRERFSYVADLDPERVLAIAATVPAAMSAVAEELAAFRAYMESA